MPSTAVIRRPLRRTPYARPRTRGHGGETEGFARAHQSGKSKILGATLVARHAGEMIGEIAPAMNAGLGLGTIADTILPYPTQVEVLRRVGDADKGTRLTPSVRRLLEHILKWRR